MSCSQSQNNFWLHFDVDFHFMACIFCVLNAPRYLKVIIFLLVRAMINQCIHQKEFSKFMVVL